MSKIAVLGPGGVGGFVAAAMKRAGEDVTVVARQRTAEQLAEHGIDVRSAALASTFTAWPATSAHLSSTVDFLLVATKAAGLLPALGLIEVEPSLVVPLLNGLDHLGLLRDHFGAQRVAAGVIRIESNRPSPGVILQTSPSCRVDLATDRPALQPKVERLAATFRAAGIPVHIGSNERQVMWSKLARLCPLALTTSACDRPIGFVRSDPRWRSALENAVAETIEVANADGAALDPTATLAELEGAPAELGSSMRRDIAAGREPELDAIAGAVLRSGARHGIRCPTLTWLTERVAKLAGIAAPV